MERTWGGFVWINLDIEAELSSFADKSFVVDDDQAGHALAAGDLVQCIVITSVSDGATGTAVIGAVRKLHVAISS